MPAQHVLVLDGEDERRQRLVQLLRAEGHVVIAERSAMAAVETLVAGPDAATPPFDLLLLDLALPGVDLAALRGALAPAAATAPDSLEAAERRHIVRVLAHTHGNRRQAAGLLGISRSTLINKIRRYGLADAGRDEP